MWTHKTPYQKSLLTRNSIRIHGEIGLYRALNIGNVVGFIGSGATVGYGRSDWRQLVIHAYETVMDLCIERINDDGFDKQAYRKDRAKVEFKDAFPVPPHESPRERQKRAELGGLWDTLQQLRGKVAPRGRTGKDGETLKLLVEVSEAVAECADAWLMARGEPRSILKDLRISMAGEVARTDVDKDERLNLDPIYEAFETLGIRRFLTVNYDSEIERFLVRRRGFIEGDRPDGFKRLLQRNVDDKGETPHRTRHAVDLMGRTAVSVTLDDHTVGELITIAALPRSREAQVFHLHGRFDDPSQMIVTERDYQRVYMAQDATRHTFLESLDTLFLGNDVLFIGIGMNEGDLLRPLRHFVAEERGSSDADARRIFALLPYHDEIEATETAVELKIRYGVQTLFFGEGQVFVQREVLKVYQNYLSGDSTPSELDTQLDKLRTAIQKGDLRVGHTSTGFQQRISQASDVSSFLQETFSDEDAEISESDTRGDRTTRTLLEETRDEMREPPITRERRDASSERIDQLRRRIATRALCQRMRDISRRRGEWWDAWQASPVHAIARYPCKTGSNIADSTTWVRHQPTYPFSQVAVHSERPSTPFKAAQKVAASVPSIGDGLRLVRLSGERGTGKGALLAELQVMDATMKVGRWQLLFTGEEKKTQAIEGAAKYAGAFFAHTSFSPEFNSVIGAIVRFIAGRVANECDIKFAEKFISKQSATVRGPLPAKGVDFEWYPGLLRSPDDSEGGEAQPLWGSNKEINRLDGLRLLLGRLKRDFKASRKRLFICLGGLDRLCNPEGTLHNPLHRSFFDILTGDPYLPLDIVLVASHPEMPIRGIKQPTGQCSRQVQQDAPDPRAVGDQVAGFLAEIGRPSPETLVPWCKLPTLPLLERYWLTGTDERKCRRRTELLASRPALQKTLLQSVALDTWVFLCAQECFIDRTDVADPEGATRTWFAKLERAALRGGPKDIIDEVFAAYREHDGRKQRLIRGAIFRHLCLFAIPVEISVLLACPEIVLELSRSSSAPPRPSSESESGREKELLDHLDALVARGLVIRIQVPSKLMAAGGTGSSLEGQSDHRQRFVLHRQMREYLARLMQLSLLDVGERNYFDVSIYCAQPPDLAAPSDRHLRHIRGVVEALISLSAETLRPFYGYQKSWSIFTSSPETPRPALPDDLPESRQIHAARQMIRAAFSVVQDTFSVGSLSKLPQYEGLTDETEQPYEIYRGWLRGILNVSTAIGYLGGRPNADGKYEEWTLRYRIKKTEGEQEVEPFLLREPLFHNEILWLYNERALTSFVEGRLFDALPIFRICLRYARRMQDVERSSASASSYGDDAHHAAERRITLNQAIAEIEFGSIQKARRRLEQLVRRAHAPHIRRPSITPILAEGYLGLCDHLAGQLDSAHRRYQTVLDYARERGLLRTTSIFYRHQADLDRLRRDYAGARKCLQLSLYAATECRQEDIQRQTLIAQTKLIRDEGKKYPDAQELLDQAESYAQQMGLIKFKIDTLKVRSEIMLAQGETEQAGRLVARAIGLASRNGLNLRKVSALILYSRILDRRHQYKLAREILERTSTEANRLGYQLKTELAARTLRGFAGGSSGT